MLAAGVIFLFALCLHIEYPKSTFADGFLFCAEAALVGGIADWFAVTALFRKPLGFPWHTAILPRRRREFTEATGRMLQNEFFSKKKLVQKVKSIDYAGRLSQWMVEADNRPRVEAWLQGMLTKNADLIKRAAAGRLTAWLDSESTAELVFDRIRQAAEKGHITGRLLDGLVNRLGMYVAYPEVRTMLLTYLEQYRDEKLNSPFAKMMGGLAENTGLIDLEEAADLTLDQSEKLLEQLSQPDSDIRQVFLSALTEAVKKSLNNKEFKQDFFDTWSNCRRRDLAIGDAILGIDVSSDAKVAGLIQWLSRLVADNLQEILSSSQPIKDVFNEAVFQIVGRGALQAQEMLGDITRDVMDSLTDEQMNHLIYDKAEPDLLWIRMNGSIVGAIVGLCIFTLSSLI